MLLTAFGKKACPGLVALLKTRRMNKLYVFPLLLGLAVSGTTMAQRITLQVTNAPLDTVFSRIQEQTPYRFVYTSEELSATKPVSFTVRKAPIAAVLALSFKDQPVDYSMEDLYVYVRKKEEARTSSAPTGQTSEIHGRVTDEKGEPLEGATVQIVKLGVRTLSNSKGEFMIATIAPGAYTLEITFVGFEKYVMTAKSPGSVPFLIVMKRSVNKLDETVIKGYYVTTNRMNVGDITVVKGEDIQKSPVGDPLMALAGRVPGLYIAQANGLPGSTMIGPGQVSLRGRNSIANGTNPLFIVDGVPFTSTSLTNTGIGGGATYLSPFNLINPADIENIEVLKDADATAIYGSRGANGVVLITTKKGTAGRTLVVLDASDGFGKADRTIPLLNSSQYLEMRHEAFANDGKSPRSTDYDLNGSWDTTRYTNWQKVLIGGTSHFTKEAMTISGGNASTQFVMGGGYSGQTTIFPGDFHDQVGSGHINLTHASDDRKFRASMSVSYATDNNVMPSTDITSQITLPPVAPPIYAGPTLNWQPISTGAYTFNNPFGTLLQKAKSTTDNLVANANLAYQLLQGLQLSVSLGYNKIEMNQNILVPLSSYSPAYAGLTVLRSNTSANNTLKTWIIEPQLNFHQSIFGGLLDILVGTTIQENRQAITNLYAQDFPSDALISNIAAAATHFTAGFTYTDYRYNGAYGRLGYTWGEKYILNVTARRDGSSRFGPGYQFGSFGAVGAGWIFTKEKFAARMLPWLNFGKVRVSYGTTGNDQILDYQFLSTYSSFPYPYEGLTGLYPTQLANPNYRWEVVKKLELGLDLGFIRNRILLNAAYYSNRTDNQLVGYSLPYVSGFSSITANLPAKIANTGFEFALSTVNINSKIFTWGTTANLSIPHNKLVAYPNLAGSTYANTYTIGQPLFSTRGYRFTTVNPTTGLYNFEDVNKDGKISSPQDYLPMPPITQMYYGAVTNTFRYGRFSLDVMVQFVGQNKYNYARFFGIAGTLKNQPTYVLARWQKPEDVTTVQRFAENNSLVSAANTESILSDRVISDASFIRLKNLALSYDLPIGKTNKPRLHLYLQGQNLLLITKFKGLDPETSVLVCPPLRMILAGLRISL